LWAFGGKREFNDTNFTPFLASSNAADTSIPIEITYLDTDGNEQTTTVTTDAADGRTPVSLGIEISESFRAGISGDTEIQGNISLVTINNFTNGVPDEQDEVVWHILAGDNQTQLCLGRVPARMKRRIKNIDCGVLRDNGGGTAIQAVFQTKAPGGVWKTSRIRIRDVSDATTFVSGTIDFEDISV